MGSWLQQHRILPFVLIARLFVRSVGRWLVCRSVIIPSRAGSSFITYRSTCLSWVPPHHRTAWCNDILRRGPQHLNIFLKCSKLIWSSFFLKQPTSILKDWTRTSWYLKGQSYSFDCMAILCVASINGYLGLKSEHFWAWRWTHHTIGGGNRGVQVERLLTCFFDFFRKLQSKDHAPLDKKRKVPHLE